MGLWVGIDVAKQLHWVVVLGEDGAVLLSRKLENTPTAIGMLIEELTGLGGSVTVGVDMTSGIAALLLAMLDAADIRGVYVSGAAVSRARRGTRGGRTRPILGTRVIADQLRVRDDLRDLARPAEYDIALRILTSRREDLRQLQTARMNGLRDLLCGVHPGLERPISPEFKADLLLLTRYVTPAEIRAAGVRRVAAFLAKNGVRDKKARALADASHAAAVEQRIVVPGQKVVAEVVREIAAELLATRERIRLLDKQLEAALEQHPAAPITLTLPGMGVVLTAEFHAEVGDLRRHPTGDCLAAASAMAPTIRQSGKSLWLRRPLGGNRRLKRASTRPRSAR